MTPHFHFRTLNAHPSPAQMNAALSEFAELLSSDLPLREIAGRMDVTGATVCVFLRMLCARMGESVEC